MTKQIAHSLRLVVYMAVAASAMLYAATANAGVDPNWYEQIGTSGNDFNFGVAYDEFNDSTYVAGSIEGALPGKSNLGGFDGFIRKYDAEGNVLWTDQFGTSAFDQVVSVDANAYGVVVVGLTDGTFPGATSLGGRDIFIKVYEHDGSVNLTKQIGTAGADSAERVSLSTTNVYITGSTNGTFSGQTSSGGDDAFISKYHMAGAHLWTRQFGTSAFDKASTIIAGTGGVYVAGLTAGSFPGFTNQGLYDAFVRKYDANGNVSWTDQYGTAEYDFGFGVSVTGSTLYVAGDTEGAMAGQTAFGDSDAYLRKYNETNGVAAWTRQFGTSAFDQGYAVLSDSSGAYIAGFSEAALPGQNHSGDGDPYVARYDSDGNQVSLNQFGTTEYEDVFGFLKAGDYLYVSGSTFGTWPGETSGGARDVYFTKLAIDTDNDGIYDAVDTNDTSASVSFDDGSTFGSILSSGDQTLTIKDHLDGAEGVLVSAALGGGATPASVSACGISTFFLDAGDEITITCGSVTFDVRAGEVSVVLTANDGRVAESTVSTGNKLTFQETGAVVAATTNTEPIVLTAGNKTVSLTPGSVDEMPSDLPIVVANITVSPAAVPVGSSAVLTADISSPSDEVSVITGASYTIDAGAVVSMTAADGLFDSETEGVTTNLGVFNTPGVYELCVVGADDVLNNSEVSCTILAVYDPTGGYVTGGGQINSPAGAYVADETATGKAHFGFIAEYENGAQTPTGNTHFRFKAGDLSFKSTSYDWLVVSGSRLQYKGYGEINKQGGYRFMLTATDGDLLGQGNGDDKLRMKIWNDATGGLVYDNQKGANDTANPSTVITNGSVVIHKD